jgi:soluble lytic murein transglycosylase
MKLVRILLFALFFINVAHAQDDASALREQFAVALTKAESGVATSSDSGALSNYILYPYLQAVRLQQALKISSDGSVDPAIREFLKKNEKSLAARELRREWLKTLAARNQWPEFIAAYQEDVADSDLRCQWLLARIKTGNETDLREDALKIWMTGQKLPNACTPPIDWAKQQGWLTPALQEQRARLALAAGKAELAESLLDGVPEGVSAPLLRWVQLIRAPQNELDQLIENPQDSVEAAAVLDAYTRLARKDPEQALKIYPRLLKARQIKGDQAAAFTSALALGLSWNHLPEAMSYFKKIPEPVTDEKVLEWRLRAAIWNGEWKQARAWSQSLPKTMATQDRWSYWRARALEKRKQSAKEAEEIYQALALKNNLYGVLASQRLGQPHTPQPQPQSVDAEAQKKLVQNPGIVRVHELNQLGRNVWAAAEWRAALQQAAPQTQLQAGLLAASWDWPSQAIPTLATVSVYDDFAVTYPLMYEKQVQEAAKEAGLSPAWVYGVMRQESLYDPQATSPANAYGLLQLLLPTAKNVARKWKQPTPSREDLFNPEINLALGAAYLHDMQEKWNGSLVLALGSYNAGPSAVARWLPDKPMDADIWIENVPYTETRGYIQRILWHICVFGWKETGQPQDLSPLLLPVSKPAA